jgi:hypothetical protein
VNNASKNKVTVTRAAELEYTMRDAHEALLLAQQDNRWLDVSKYALQIAAAQQALVRLGTVQTLHGRGTTHSEAA